MKFYQNLSNFTRGSFPFKLYSVHSSSVCLDFIDLFPVDRQLRPLRQATGEVNSTTWIRTLGSICAAPMRFTVVFENKTATCFSYCQGVFVRGRWLAKLICHSEGGEMLIWRSQRRRRVSAETFFPQILLRHSVTFREQWIWLLL